MGDGEGLIVFQKKNNQHHIMMWMSIPRGGGPVWGHPPRDTLRSLPCNPPLWGGNGRGGGKGGHPHRDTMLIFLIKKSASVSPHLYTPLYIKGV